MTQSKSAVAVSHKYVIQYQIEKHFKPLKMFCRVVISEADIKRVGVGPLVCWLITVIAIFLYKALPLLWLKPNLAIFSDSCGHRNQEGVTVNTLSPWWQKYSPLHSSHGFKQGFRGAQSSSAFGPCRRSTSPWPWAWTGRCGWCWRRSGRSVEGRCVRPWSTQGRDRAVGWVLLFYLERTVMWVP